MELLKQYVAALKPAHRPAVGWLTGLAACASFALVALLLHGNLYTPLVAAIGCTIVTALLTGGRPESELMTVAGAQGVLTLVLALMLKICLLAVLAGQSEAGVLLALFAAHTLSRFAPLIQRIGQRELAIAGAWCVPPLLAAMLARGVAFVVWPLLFTAIAWWTLRLWLVRRGQGEAANATQQVCEIAYYLGAAIAFG